MTKTDLLAFFDSAAEIARFFGITEQAVSQWSDDDPIPPARQWELRAKFPGMFPIDESGAPTTPQDKAA